MSGARDFDDALAGRAAVRAGGGVLVGQDVDLDDPPRVTVKPMTATADPTLP